MKTVLPQATYRSIRNISFYKIETIISKYSEECNKEFQSHTEIRFTMFRFGLQGSVYGWEQKSNSVMTAYRIEKQADFGRMIGKKKKADDQGRQKQNCAGFGSGGKIPAAEAI